MQPIPVTDAAELVDEGYEDPWLFVCYAVYGWLVEIRAQVGTPWDGPERLAIEPDYSVEGIDVALSTDGVTTDVLRAIPLADARKRLRRLRVAARNKAGKLVVKDRLSTYDDWAEFAKVYADAAADGRRQPLQYLAELSGLSRNTLSARVRRAREMGLLTRPNDQGLGSLTERAKRVLAQATGDGDDG